MSIISVYETDKSDFLYRRFATLASSYLDKPETAREPSAKVPLENLFRLLEMFRYDAFSDERRSGVLAVDNVDINVATHPAEEAWHTKIEKALNHAMSNVYGNTSKEEAIRELEGVLSWLAVDGDIDNEIQEKAKQFFISFLKEMG